jgi:hypothetical protein
LPKVSPGAGGQAEVYRIAAACHPGYDRIVMRFRFARPGYDVRFVTKIVPPSGVPVSLPGRAKLRVRLEPARAHAVATGAALLPRVLTPHCTNPRRVRLAEDFEGVVTFGLGLDHRAGFRVLRLTSPTRVVVDVAH